MDNKAIHASILIAGLAAIAGNLIPTPADAAYFNFQRNLKEKQAANQISPKQFWIRNCVAYYTFPPIWWGLVLVATLNIKGDIKNKIGWGLGIVGAGAVIGAIYLNIKKEKETEQKTS
jgi:hypothetical protein